VSRDQTLQVNVLSTALLAMLLLPWMKSERANRSSPAHLVIVGSGQHVGHDMAAWETYIAEGGEGGVLAHYNKPSNWPGPGPMYGVTKLMVEYVSHELAEFAKGDNGR
jgi:NAD(P)-dependent dehydrogenase (short-subunit alcohol dehydrogenase family)